MWVYPYLKRFHLKSPVRMIILKQKLYILCILNLLWIWKYKIGKFFKVCSTRIWQLTKFKFETVLAIYMYPSNIFIKFVFTRRCFPDEMKIANVIPLFKCDNPELFNNSRPVSVLCSVSKVFEKIMYNRLRSYLYEHKTLFSYQFGFRKSHSTYMALMTLMDNLINFLDNGEYVIGIFQDFSKAFDTVDHGILLQKLSSYGVRGEALIWFQSYLSNKYQFVTYNGVSSEKKEVKCGVPQGSILGP